MTTYNYVVLSTSDAGLTKRFKAIKMATPWDRTDSFQITLGGKLDKSAGVIIETWHYTFRVPVETDDENLGTYEDLRTFFFLNNPNGSPSDLLTLVDHFGNTHYVKFNENTAPEPLTTQLEGPNAWHYFNVSFINVGEPGS